MKYRLFCRRNRHEFIVELPDELAGHIGAAGPISRAVPSKP
jgi:hypothetical protein